VYEGTVRHRRYSPFENEFEYELFMMFLPLDEIETVLEDIPGWSADGFAPAWFRNSDHLGPNDQPLHRTIRDLVEERTNFRPGGSVYLLTHLRYFGYCFNPVSFYYCFNDHGRMETVIPEVSNTPWGDLDFYVLPRTSGTERGSFTEFCFDKSFYVSPFMPPDIGYRMKINVPHEHHLIHIDSYRESQRIFDATLKLTKKPFTRRNLTWFLLKHPLMTMKVIGGIYYEALKIWFKESVFYPHPADGVIRREGDPS